MRFQGKVSIVTGAAAGIGEATALAFARERAVVAIVDVDPEQSEILAEKIKDIHADSEIFITDVSSETDVQAMVKGVMDHWGHVDILVNNAGIYYQGDALNTTLEKWHRIMEVNLTGAFLCTKYAAKAMGRSGKGVIINVASEAGLVGIKDQVAYNVSKGGMIELTRSCAVDFADIGIRVNCVCPGTTDTPLVRAAVNRAPDPSAARRALEEVRPLNRLGKPEEIASAILFMASDEVAYATGSILCVDGGYTTQ